FHHMLLSRTPLVQFLPSPGLRDAYTWARERILFLLETVPQIARRAEPTFTFAHVLAPHPPFVFGEDGEDVSPHERSYYLTVAGPSTRASRLSTPFGSSSTPTSGRAWTCYPTGATFRPGTIRSNSSM